MALSRPLLGIQSPIQCPLCEQGAKISWKCLECDLLMCSTCKNNVHPKIKTAKEHRIIDIKEIGLCDEKSTTNESKVSVELHVVEEFQTKLGCFSYLAVSLDDSLWIGDGEYKRGFKLFSSHTGLQKVKTVGNKLQVISSFNILAGNISMTPNNDLLIITDGATIKQIKNQANKITDSAYAISQPYQPMVVHVTRKYKVIVGVFDERYDHTSLILVMNLEGDRERVYGDDQAKNISFNLPSKITDTNIDNIFVIDTINTDTFEGTVKVLGLDNIINTYSGHSVINTKSKPFTPTSLATSPADNVIIADIDSNVLHILNASGELMTYISTLDRGIDGPFSICLTMAGQFCILYIGTSANVGGKDKGKLYKLNIVGI